MCQVNNSPFVYDVWIIDNNYKRLWYTRCSSADYAEKRREQFIKETPTHKYRTTLITFHAKKYENWDVGDEWHNGK